MSPLLLVVLFATTVAAALLAFEAGLRFGRWRAQRPDPEQLRPVGLFVTGTMGLLSFILGFTFGLASSHRDVRNQSAFDEAVAIGTTYRRAELLPSPEGANLRHLIRDYVNLRLEARRSSNLADLGARLRQLQERMWAEAVAAGKKDIGSSAVAPLMESLSDVIDVHGERVLAGMQSRIPSVVWAGLNGIMAVSLAAAGYHAGLAGTRRSVAAAAYAVAFAAVIVLIAAGDLPSAGQLETGQQELRNLRARLAVP
jgi:hypothetical protein